VRHHGCQPAYALNAATGAVVWIFNATGSSTVDAIGGLTLDHSTNTVFVVAFRSSSVSQETVIALNSITGAKRWGRDLGAIEVEPVLAAGRVLVFTRVSTVYALDRFGGATLWQRTVNSSEYAAAPVSAVFDAPSGSIVVYALDTGGTLHALQDQCFGSTSGLWDFKPNDARITTTAANLGEYLYVADNEGRVWQVRVNDGVANAWATVAPAGSVSAMTQVLFEQLALPRLVALSGQNP
jgi:outer membrane protein assembly factor BamB